MKSSSGDTKWAQGSGKSTVRVGGSHLHGTEGVARSLLPLQGAYVHLFSTVFQHGVHMSPALVPDSGTGYLTDGTLSSMASGSWASRAEGGLTQHGLRNRTTVTQSSHGGNVSKTSRRRSY